MLNTHQAAQYSVYKQWNEQTIHIFKLMTVFVSRAFLGLCRGDRRQHRTWWPIRPLNISLFLQLFTHKSSRWMFESRIWTGCPEGWSFRWSGEVHMLKLSPQPHVPLMLGLLNTNSLESFVSTKSISVPSSVSWAFFSMNTLTPGESMTFLCSRVQFT